MSPVWRDFILKHHLNHTTYNIKDTFDLNLYSYCIIENHPAKFIFTPEDWLVDRCLKTFMNRCPESPFRGDDSSQISARLQEYTLKIF